MLVERHWRWGGDSGRELYFIGYPSKKTIEYVKAPFLTDQKIELVSERAGVAAVLGAIGFLIGGLVMLVIWWPIGLALLALALVFGASLFGIIMMTEKVKMHYFMLGWRATCVDSAQDASMAIFNPAALKGWPTNEELNNIRKILASPHELEDYAGVKELYDGFFRRMEEYDFTLREDIDDKLGRSLRLQIMQFGRSVHREALMLINELSQVDDMGYTREERDSRAAGLLETGDITLGVQQLPPPFQE